jgi:(2Fe-2S) ferredoxin
VAHTRLTLRPVLCAVLVLVAGCATPTAPTPSPVPGVSAPVVKAGTWKGAFEITSCTGACRSGPEAFVLRLASDGTGVVQLDNQVWTGAPPIAVDVSASVSAGTTALTGTAAAPQAMELRLVLTELGDQLQGLLRYSYTRDGALVSKEGRVLFASRDRTVYPARFHGTWVGMVTRTACTGDCTAADPVLDTYQGYGGTRLLLAQVGTSVLGRLNAYDVSGTAPGSALQGQGYRAVEPASCRAGYDYGTNVAGNAPRPRCLR